MKEASNAYYKKSFTRVSKHLPKNGELVLDTASGPIGLQEYLDLTKNFKIRVCVDISLRALIKAHENYGEEKRIYICGDIANIPLNDGIFDATFSQHTLYHVDRNLQKKAIEEMYKVTKEKGKVIIV